MKTLAVLAVLTLVLAPLSLAEAIDLRDAKQFINRTAHSAGYDVSKTGNAIFDSTIGTIIGAALSLIGIIFLGLMIYGGFLWMTDRGNEQQVKRAQSLISAAVIGLVIVMSAYAVSYFVLSKIQAGTLNTSTTPPPFPG